VARPRCCFAYLRPEKRQELYGEEGEHVLFSFLDARPLGPKFSQAQFWEQALRPLEEIISADSKSAQKDDTVAQEKNSAAGSVQAAPEPRRLFQRRGTPQSVRRPERRL